MFDVSMEISLPKSTQFQLRRARKSSVAKMVTVPETVLQSSPSEQRE